MSTTTLPLIVDGIVSFATTALTATACRVVDGIDISEDPGDVLMVGVDDLLSDNQTSGSSDQAVATMGAGRPRDEVGAVTCVAISTVGEDDQKAARDNAYGYLAALEDALRADPSLGITARSYVVAEVGAGTRLLQGKGDGATAVVIFTIGYKARI